MLYFEQTGMSVLLLEFMPICRSATALAVARIILVTQQLKPLHSCYQLNFTTTAWSVKIPF